MEKILFTRKEAAQILSISLATLDRYIVLKEIPVRRLGKRVMIHHQDLERFARRDHDEPFTRVQFLNQSNMEGVTA